MDMDWTQIIVSLIGLLGTVIPVLISNSRLKKSQEQKMGELQGVVGNNTTIISSIQEKQQTMEAKTNEVLRVSLRGDLYNLYSLTKQGEGRTDKSDDIFIQIWNEYTRLGGNAWGEDIKAKYYALPTKE